MLKYVGNGSGVQGVPKRDLSDDELVELKTKHPEVHSAVIRCGFWEEAKENKRDVKKDDGKKDLPKEDAQKSPDPKAPESGAPKN